MMGRGDDDRWDRALDTVGAHTGDRFGVFADLVRGHDESHRCYHVFEHASSVVDGVLALHQPGDDWATAVLAAWFHDLVYDPRAPHGANEGASAVRAGVALDGLGVSLTAIGTVTRLICLTAHHRPRPHDRVGALLCDADLAILGAPELDYDAYVAAVRAEYGHLDDETWAGGRRSFLRSALDRTSLYTTDEARRRWEQAARTNISRELHELH